MTNGKRPNTERAAFIDQLARSFHLDPEQAGAAVNAMTDEIKYRIERHMLSRGGVADVVSLLAAPTAANLNVTKASDLSAAEITTAGNSMLDVLIGNKHVSRGIAARAARQTGLDEALLRKMLPVITGAVLTNLQRQAAPQLEKIAEKIPAFQSPLPLPGQGSSANTGEWTSRAQPSNGPSTRQNAPISGGSPLPIPGDNIPGIGRNAPRTNNPFDNLPDIVRRGGTRVPNDGGSPGGGGSLEGIIRSILGSLLGFGGKRGVIGTMIQLFLIRWLTNLARRFLTRIFTRR